jgi:hypothetical protein
MNRFYTISILILTAFGNIAFTQIYTPNGTSVDYKIFSPINVAQIENEAAAFLANRGWTNIVIKTGDASVEYNCHAYAWYMSEGDTVKYWIDAFNAIDLDYDWINYGLFSHDSIPPEPNNVSKYWNDGSYIEVFTESEATKVWYGSCWQWDNLIGWWVNDCDHSAVRLPSGLYESKWGNWPRYRHPADKSYIYAITNRKYFKRNEISGSDSLYYFQPATYSISNLPAGTNITWGGTNVIITGGQGTNTTTIYACGGEIATLTATLSGAANGMLSKTLTVVNNANLTATRTGINGLTITLNYPYASCFDWVISSNLTSSVGNGTKNCINNSSLTCTLVSDTDGTVQVRAKNGSCVTPWFNVTVTRWHPEIDLANSNLNPMPKRLGQYGREPFSAYLVESCPVAGSQYRWCFYHGTDSPYLLTPLCWETTVSYVSSNMWPCGYNALTVTVTAGNYIDSVTADFYGTCNGGMLAFSAPAKSLPNLDSYSAAYPNPASNELIIDRIEEENDTEITAINTQNAKVKSSNITVLLYSHSTAQLVYNKTYSSSDKQIKIDTSKLPNGIYHLNIIEDKEKIKEQTIIVNH